MRVSRCFVSCFFALLLAQSAFAQNLKFNDLKVKVTDPASAAVSGARVAVYAEHGRVLARSTTDAQGITLLSHLPEKTPLHVEILAPGFAPYTVTLTDAHELNAHLQVATASETVVVSATPSPIEAGLTGMNVSTLDAAQLETMQPIAASDAIRFLPGVILGDSGNRGGQTSLFVRGGDSDYNKVFVDGVPVSDPGGYFDFGTLPLTGAGRIELLRGGESVLYGADAMSSVVQISSEAGHTRTPELRFGADGGNFGLAHGYASLGGVLRRFDYNLFADELFDNGQGVNDFYENSAQGANLGMQIAPNQSVRLRLRHNDSRSGVPGEQFPSFGIPASSDAYAHQDNLLASLAWSLVAPANWQHNLTVYNYNHQRHDTDPCLDPNELYYPYCAYNSYSDINRFGLRYNAEVLEQRRARSSFGYEFEDENGFIGDTVYASVNHGLRLNHALYGEQFVELGRLTAIAGARYVHNDSFGNRVVPRTSLTYLVHRGQGLWGNTRLKGSFSESIKEPSFEQSFGFTGYGVYPNPNLKPEQAHTFDAGIEQKLGRRWEGVATYFHSIYSDQITSNGNYSQYINLNKALAHGAELDLSGRVGNHLRVQGSYFYTSTQILVSPLGSFPNAAGDPLLLRPKHAGTLLLSYQRSRFGGTLGGSFLGRRPDSDYLGLGLTHAPGYARVDAGGWYQLERRVQLYANVENLLNRHYQEVLGYPALSINFRAGLRFQLGGD